MNGETGNRIFVLFGNKLCGESLYSAREIKSLDCMPIYWGSWGKLNSSRWGLIIGNLTSLGEEGLEYTSPAGGMYFRVSGSTGDQEFGDLTLMGTLKLNSVGE